MLQLLFDWMHFWTIHACRIALLLFVTAATSTTAAADCHLEIYGMQNDTLGFYQISIQVLVDHQCMETTSCMVCINPAFHSTTFPLTHGSYLLYI